MFVSLDREKGNDGRDNTKQLTTCFSQQNVVDWPDPLQKSPRNKARLLLSPKEFYWKRWFYHYLVESKSPAPDVSRGHAESQSSHFTSIWAAKQKQCLLDLPYASLESTSGLLPGLIPSPGKGKVAHTRCLLDHCQWNTSLNKIQLVVAVPACNPST